jgi:hypothetical protein
MKAPNRIIVYDRSMSEMTAEEIGKMTFGEVRERGINALAMQLWWAEIRRYLAEHNLALGDDDTLDGAIPEKVLRDFEEQALKKAAAHWAGEIRNTKQQ